MTSESSIRDAIELHKKDLAEAMSQPLQTQEVYCKDCKHLLGRRTYLDGAANWKCAALENIDSSTRSLVTGETIIKRKYETCADARASAMGCSSSGFWFEKYEYPVELYHPEQDFVSPGLPEKEPSPAVIAARQRAAARTSKTKLTSDDLENL